MQPEEDDGVVMCVWRPLESYTPVRCLSIHELVYHNYFSMRLLKKRMAPSIQQVSRRERTAQAQC